MRFKKPSTAGHLLAIALVGGQAWWILKVDACIPELIPPLFPLPWQKLLSCVFVAGVALAAAAVRPGESVKSEFFYFAVRSILIGAVLTFFGFEAIHLENYLTLLRDPRGGRSSDWAEFPYVLLAWPIVSLSVFGVTAGDPPTPQAPAPPRHAG